MAAYVLAQGAAHPDKIALIVGGAAPQSFTYAELQSRVRLIGAGLMQIGVRSGDRVLMRVGNTPDFPMVYLGAIAIGAVPIPTSTALTQPEVTRIAQETRPVLIVADTGITLPEGQLPVLYTNEIARFASRPPCDFDLGDPHRPAYIVYTSGTAGAPRAVVHAHRAIWARQSMFKDWYDLRRDDRVLHAGAFNWTYTLGTGLMDPWTIGATAIVPSSDTELHDIPVLLRAHSATIFAAAPGVYRKLLKHDMSGLDALRHGVSAGEKLPESTALDWQAATGTRIYEAFGASECSTFISAAPARPAKPDQIGFVQAGRKATVRHEEHGVSDGEIGEISVHKDDCGLMLGYLQPDGHTDLPLNDGWFGTGDLACVDDDGALRYLGRRDDMMNAGGYRVSPIEVENVLATHPDVTEVACCVLQVKRDVTVIGAFYTGPNVIDEEDLQTHAARQLARYKCPKIYTRVNALPRGANNKLKRRDLRETWEAAHGQT